MEKTFSIAEDKRVIRSEMTKKKDERKNDGSMNYSIILAIESCGGIGN